MKKHHQTSVAMAITHNLSWADQSPCIIQGIATLEWQLSFYCWAYCYMAWNIPLFRLVQLSQLCPLPTSCSLLAYCLRCRVGNWASLDAMQTCANTVQHSNILPVTVNTILVINSKHSTIQAGTKTINTIPARPSTPIHIKICACWKNGNAYSRGCIHVHTSVCQEAKMFPDHAQ